MLIGGAIVLAAFALLGGGLLEVGQWYTHRRALQVRTDAATLAAGQALNACFNIGTTEYPNEQAADRYIESWAQDYGGLTPFVSLPSQTGAPYNGSATAIPYMSFQSDTPPSAGTPQPAKNLGNECYIDGNPANTAPANVNLMEDVRTTQSALSPFFSFSPFVDVHGWARVQLQQITALKPSMPLAVPDVNPKHVAVTLVNNSTGAAACSADVGFGPCVFPLTGPTASGILNNWSGTGTITMPAVGTNVGVRVSIGSQNGTCAGVNETATYKCYDYSNSGGANTNGIVVMRSYDDQTAGSTSAPVLRDVTPSTCVATDQPGGTPYFSANQAPGTCDWVVVSANVDFGNAPDYTKAQVTGSLKGSSGGSIPITLSHTTGNMWVSAPISLPLGAGAYKVFLSWQYNSNKGNFNGGNSVQQIFSASDGSDATAPGGPIMAASILDGTTGLPSYSFPAGKSASFAVTISLTGGVHINPKCSDANGNSGPNYKCPNPKSPTGYDPPVLLRAASTSGSLNYAINCGIIPGNPGPNSPLYQMMRFGCLNSFSLNSADVCPDPANPVPTDCAPVQQVTGDKVGPVQSALNDRLDPTGSKCAPNNYPNTAVPGDPRVVLLVDTDFSAFTTNGGSSGSNVPVITFATFYITGWDGADKSCAPLSETAPPNADTKGNSADIWGHFINYDTQGTPSGVKCKVSELAPCVAALVR
jgi:hypothetical protein